MRKNIFLLTSACAVIAATLVLTILFWPFIQKLGDSGYRETFSAWVKGLGWKGIAVSFGLMVTQIIIAVIPGGPTELIAGAAYGAWGGLAICAAGSVFASAVVFSVVERFGLPLVRRFFGKEKIESWKFFRDTEKTARLIFILFLIPGIPKDLLTWLAPASGFPMRRFIVLSTLGRIPAILCTTIMGDAMLEGNRILFVAIFLITAAAGFLGLHFRDRIVKAVKPKSGEAETEKDSPALKR